MSHALARIVSGCHVLTVNDPESGPEGVLLSFVQQVGFRPPRIMAAIEKERAVVPALERAGGFVLNICAQGDKILRGRFAEPADNRAKMFAELGSRPLGSGYVFEQAAAYLACRVVERVDIGDHWVYIADVHDGSAVEGRSPLVHVRRSGLDY
jgi:flavin reductase (DIM6/NTAB) family NADH-FMN oxidoreductase RutF